MEKYKNPFNEKVFEFDKLLDLAFDEKKYKKMIDIIQEINLEIENLDDISKSKMFYSLATAYGNLAFLNNKFKNEKNIEKQIFYYRESINLIESINKNEENNPYILGFKLNLYTNYANCLDSIGRKILAIDYYNKALNINPNFMMAMGNIGIAYFHYSMIDYNKEHQHYFNYFAYSFLNEAMNEEDPINEQSKIYMKKYLDAYSESYKKDFLEKDLKINEIKIKNKNEREYREWVLKNKLFLNTANDLPLDYFVFANDDIHISSIITESNKFANSIFGLYNQIKQEYIYSRYLYYESLNYNEHICYADKETNLIDTLDYPVYSIRSEKMKTAYRTLYSLLDKIAFFINHYFDLGIKERDVSFSSIWWTEKKGKDGYEYKNILKKDDNFAIMSIYWISKDFYHKLYKSPNPKAKKLSEIRNHLEHKYLKISDGLFQNLTYFNDDLAYYITEEEFQNLTLELLKLIREVIINLSLAVNINEKKKLEKLKNEKKSEPIKANIYKFDDEWKI